MFSIRKNLLTRFKDLKNCNLNLENKSSDLIPWIEFYKFRLDNTKRDKSLSSALSRREASWRRGLRPLPSRKKTGKTPNWRTSSLPAKKLQPTSATPSRTLDSQKWLNPQYSGRPIKCTSFFTQVTKPLKYNKARRWCSRDIILLEAGFLPKRVAPPAEKQEQ